MLWIFSDLISAQTAQQSVTNTLSLDTLLSGATAPVQITTHWDDVVSNSDGSFSITGHPNSPLPSGAKAQVANLPLWQFNQILNTNGRGDLNTNNTVGFLAWGDCILQQTINFPYSGEYQFSIPAYYVTDARPLGNSLQVMLDQTPLQTVGAAAGNDFTQFVSNVAPSQNYIFKGFVIAGNHSILVRLQGAAYNGQLAAQVHVDRLIITSTGNSFPTEPAGSRDPSLYPMSSNSLWNQSITDAAQWSASGDADTVQITSATGIINGGQWSIPVYLGQPTDPTWIWQGTDNSISPDVSIPGPRRQIHSPSVMSVAPPISGGDHNIAVIDTTNKRYVYTGFGGSVSGQTLTIGRGKWIDNYAVNPGMGQDEGNYLGLIRIQDLIDGEINHQLIFGLATQLVKAGTTTNSGLAWPAYESDFNGPFGLYTGQVLYGSKIGVPVGTVASSLSAPGLSLWNALMNYGAVMNVTGGQPSNQVTFYVEQAAEGRSDLTAMRGDLSKIMPFLRIMRNHTSATPNGGGNALLPLRPGIIQGMSAILP